MLGERQDVMMRRMAKLIPNRFHYLRVFTRIAIDDGNGMEGMAVCCINYIFNLFNLKLRPIDSGTTLLYPLLILHVYGRAFLFGCELLDFSAAALRLLLAAHLLQFLLGALA